jgi:Brp/Blh family beta-carotene 15,15'-monooxygenase
MKSINSTGERLPLSGVVISGPPSRSFPASSPFSPGIIESKTASPWTLSPLLLAALCIVNAFLPEFSTRYAWVPFLASLFFLGMPHGASDFARMGDFFGAHDWKNRCLFFSLYLFGMGLVLLLSLIAPGLSLLGFVAISVWHFGRSDLYPARGTVPSFLRLASRGMMLLSLPIAAQPEPVQNLVDGWMSILGNEALSETAWTRVTSTAPVIAGISITSSILIIALFGLCRDFASFRRELLETAVLVTMLILLNPVFALGAYFLLWHSLRHLKIQSGREVFSFNRLRELCGLDPRRAILFIPTVAAYVVLSIVLFDSWKPDLQVALLLIFFAVVTPSHEILHAIIQRSRSRAENRVLRVRL